MQRNKTGLDGILAIFGNKYELFEAGNGGELQKLNVVPDLQALRSHKRNFILQRKTTQHRAYESVKMAAGSHFADGNATGSTTTRSTLRIKQEKRKSQAREYGECIWTRRASSISTWWKTCGIL